MSLTAQRCIARMRQAMDYAEFPTDLPGMELVNEAGRTLITMRQWKFLERPQATLPLVAAQTYVVLPTDFGTMIGDPVVGGNMGGSFQWTSQSELLQLRAYVPAPTNTAFWGAIVYPPPSGSAPLGPPRIELYPTPQTNVLDGLRIAYRAGWVQLTDDQGYIPIPEFMELFFIRLCQEIALGYFEKDKGTLEERLATLRMGSLFDEVATHDGMSQNAYGPISMGGAEIQLARTGWPFGDIPVADPSP